MQISIPRGKNCHRNKWLFSGLGINGPRNTHIKSSQVHKNQGLKRTANKKDVLNDDLEKRKKSIEEDFEFEPTCTHSRVHYPHGISQATTASKATPTEGGKGEEEAGKKEGFL